MAYTKTWTLRIPVNDGDDEDLLVWLTRESAETTAAGLLLEVVEFDDLGWVDPEDIPPLGVKQLGEQYSGCRFRQFRVVARRPQVA